MAIRVTHLRLVRGAGSCWHRCKHAETRVVCRINGRTLELGIVVWPSTAAMHPAELARAAEERGFDSIFVAEHTHVPVSSANVVHVNTGSPFTAGKSMGERYKDIHDPLLWLAMAATSTSRIKLGTGICNVVQRDPILLAKTVASLDIFSNGRLIFGIGYGWNQPELRNHGIDPARRRKIFREKVLAMQRLWRDPTASFEGEFVKISESLFFPKPVQKPNPPLYLGVRGNVGTPEGRRPADFRHLVEYCDGWMPSSADFEPPLDVKLLEVLRLTAEESGRDPKTIRLSAHRVPADPRVLDRLAELGFERATITVPSDSRSVTLPVLDTYAKLIERYARPMASASTPGSVHAP
jgi:probable F420-dependent oxidoreductase